MYRKKQYFFNFVVLAISAILFLKSFSTYFSQDDFFHLRASWVNSLSDFWKFFSFSSVRGYAFYRPVSREVFNFVMWRLFGLNPFPFHVFQFLVFGLNLFLFDKFLFNLFPSKTQTRLLAIFFYAISAVHLGTFYYLASIQILLSVTFIFLTLIFFQKEHYQLSFVFFVFSLLCHEISYLIPVLLFITAARSNLRKALKFITPFLIVTILFFWLNVSFIKLPNQQAYSPQFSLKKIVNNLAWYFVWVIGIPEHMLDFIGPGFKLNSRIINYYPFHFWAMIIFFVCLILVLFVKIISLISQNKFSLLIEDLLFSIAWFLAAVLIFLVLPTHRFVYYLILAQIGISLSLALIVSRNFGRLSCLIIIFYFILNLNTIKWGEKTYWPLNRSRLAKKLVLEIKRTYPSLPQGATLYLKNDSSFIPPNQDWGGTARQAYLALSGADGAQMVYNDFSLKVNYEGNSPPSSKERVFEFIVKSF